MVKGGGLETKQELSIVQSQKLSGWEIPRLRLHAVIRRRFIGLGFVRELLESVKRFTYLPNSKVLKKKGRAMENATSKVAGFDDSATTKRL